MLVEMESIVGIVVPRYQSAQAHRLGELDHCTLRTIDLDTNRNILWQQFSASRINQSANSARTARVERHPLIRAERVEVAQNAASSCHRRVLNR